MSKRILFLTLETFSAAGGIQSMNRTLAYSLHELCKKNNWDINLYSLNDLSADVNPKYLPFFCFKGFNKNKAMFTLKSIMNGMNTDLVLLSHVNLSVIGHAIRLLNPGCKIWLVAHGIEVWQPLKGWKKRIWDTADRFICVSQFTKSKVIDLHGAKPAQCVVLNNALDPFMKLPEKFDKPEYLLRRYRLRPEDKVIFTLTRINSDEKFKGYDHVIAAIARIKQRVPSIKYILAGPCEPAEKKRIEQLVSDHGLSHNFILTGYIEEEELADHYLLADLFVLPSKKEGFGIVFIEAMAYGLPVICGNIDGSIDAVRNAEMGLSIDPDDLDALEMAILQKLSSSLTLDDRKNIQRQCLKHFNEPDYRDILEKLIIDEITD
ncbi:Glycosyltransferase involved in cell wall bisynthesis [Pedobacter sp. ok626]|uniref:glycosyltransferase family 4 protein n=1 Tax=Pedobacter sp. ok626 TaxID=1761882 RepID=UPI00088C4650|nr:glycosyltransferase family 4 protein [Pedobacter sp. ok626]SDJ31003.1 Glycosyltransferase involved in cell wall bisynthesis [Pedobacter sp. ok626]